MARSALWLTLVCLAGALRAAAADPPMSPELPVPVPAIDSDAPNDLVMAASCIERGQDAAAITYLARYVADFPDRVNVRAYLAELLWRRERHAEAKVEFARFVVDAQSGGAQSGRLVHAHTRLMCIAKAEGDAYGEHLHRGIGLYRLATQAAADDAEPLFCKAAGELTLADRARRDAARPQWYLHLVWKHLGQSQPAARALSAATTRRLASDLTPAERHDLDRAAAAQAVRADLPSR